MRRLLDEFVMGLAQRRHRLLEPVYLLALIQLIMTFQPHGKQHESPETDDHCIDQPGTHEEKVNASRTDSVELRILQLRVSESALLLFAFAKQSRDVALRWRILLICNENQVITPVTVDMQIPFPSAFAMQMKFFDNPQ